METMQEHVINMLQAILQDLEAMEPQAKAGSAEATADHEGWMKERESIREKVRQAELTALWTIPPEVEKVLGAIQERKCVLLNINP